MRAAQKKKNEIELFREGKDDHCEGKKSFNEDYWHTDDKADKWRVSE